MDWAKIDASHFEKLCYAYAKSNYGKFTWEATPCSWDGNKDGEFLFEIESINQLIKGWYESKYTRYPHQSIPHAHMDSTLVSGILDGHVVYILFITNGRITSDFKRRANAILLPHRIEANFIDGELLEDWLQQNQDIYQEFFGTQFPECDRLFKPKLVFEDACFFDGVLSAPILTAPLKSLTVGNEYYLYIGIQSNVDIKCRLSFNTNSLKILSPNGAQFFKNLKIGHNSIFLRCRTSCTYHGNFQVKFEATDENLSAVWETKNLIIDDNHDLRIFYASQTSALHQIYDFLRTECTNNAILSVVGGGGTGKSYLIRKLIESLSQEPSEYLAVQFSVKKAENASTLCKLILFLNFGYLYNLSEEAFYELISSSINLPLELFLKLREGTNNQITALQAIEEIVLLCKDTSDYAIIPTYNLFTHKHVSYIYLDDIQKLSAEYAWLFQSIVLEFITRQFSQVIILGYRPQEFLVPELEGVLQECSQNRWTLDRLSPQDIQETLAHEFNSYFGGLSEMFPLPLNVLHLCMLIRHLHLKHKNITLLGDLQASKCFVEAYQAVNSQNNAFARHKVEATKYPKQLYLIYKIESGICKEILYEFWGAPAEDIFHELLTQGLIKESNGMVIPFHDAYLYAFQKCSYNTSHNLAVLSEFLHFIQQRQENNAVLESNIISILIAEGDMSIPNIREIGCYYCRRYYDTAQYYAAKLLAKSLLPDIEFATPDQFDLEMLETLYIYAQSVKFTECHTQSTKLFRKLIKFASRNNVTPQIVDISWDSLSEVLNNEMWMLNVNEANNCMEKLSKYKLPAHSTTYGENAYLNYLNRKMMCESFFESIDLTESYQKALLESRRLNRRDYIAYAQMDCAKTLYTTAPEQSISMLKEACGILEEKPGFYRRLLECRSEIIMLEALLYDSDYEKLYELQKEMLTQGYINSYAKTTIKILMLELVKGAVFPDVAKDQLNRLILQAHDAISTKRLSIIIYQLLSLASHIDGDLAAQQKYGKMHYEAVRQMNSSYTDIPKHNINCSASLKGISWILGTDTPKNSFWLDPRLW